MSPIFNIIDRMMFENIKNFKLELSRHLTAFTLCMNEDMIRDQLFNELIKLINESQNKDLDMEIKKIMYNLMVKYGYSENKLCNKLYMDLYETLKEKS